MSVFSFAVVDPDVDQPPSSITYVREKVSFPPGSSLIEAIILSSTTFSNLPYLSSRGLDLVIFNGKQMDSEKNMTVSISDLTELWHTLLLDFSKIFHITFQLNRSRINFFSEKKRGVPRYSAHFLHLLIELLFAQPERITKKGIFCHCPVVNSVPLIDTVQLPISHF